MNEGSFTSKKIIAAMMAAMMMSAPTVELCASKGLDMSETIREMYTEVKEDTLEIAE